MELIALLVATFLVATFFIVGIKVLLGTLKFIWDNAFLILAVVLTVIFFL